jgi:hypothetical protein
VAGSENASFNPFGKRHTKIKQLLVAPVCSARIRPEILIIFNLQNKCEIKFDIIAEFPSLTENNP